MFTLGLITSKRKLDENFPTGELKFVVVKKKPETENVIETSRPRLLKTPICLVPLSVSTCMSTGHCAVTNISLVFVEPDSVWFHPVSQGCHPSLILLLPLFYKYWKFERICLWVFVKKISSNSESPRSAIQEVCASTREENELPIST